MSSCTLHVAGLLLVSSDDVPLHAEYALFDPGEIELRASGPGTVREMGYTTTAKKARVRLEEFGIDARLVEAVENALRESVAATYARGDSVRLIAPSMSAGELLDGGVWMAEEQLYRGTWLQLDALAQEIEITQASLALQAVSLASFLADVADDALVVLSTLDYTRDRRPGERTHRRVDLAHATELPSAIAALPRSQVRDPSRGPARELVLEEMRKRAEVISSPAGKERMIRFERALAERQQPQRGPLSDSSVWKLEMLLAHGHTDGVADTLDALERMRGRSPTTAYLRARAALLNGEDAKGIAEKVAALSMSMGQAFPELELLIAEAWAAAGDMRRALPYARDLVQNPALHADLRLRAESIVRNAEAGGVMSGPASLSGSEQMRVAQDLMSGAPSSKIPSAAPTAPALTGRTASSAAVRSPIMSSIPPTTRASGSYAATAQGMHRPASVPPPAAPSPSPASEEMPDLDALPRQSSAPPTRRASQPVRMPSRANLPVPTHDALPHDLTAGRSQPPPIRPSGQMSAPHVSRTPTGAGLGPKSVPPPSNRDRRVSVHPDPRAEPDSATSLPHGRENLEDIVELNIPVVHPRPSQEPPELELDDDEPTPLMPPVAPVAPAIRRSSSSALRAANDRPRTDYMRGASQPAIKAVQAAPLPATNAPMFPRVDPAALELAASLDLPYGLADQRWSGVGVPRSVLEARLHFVALSRQLGVMYKQELGIELTADVAGIEAMQRYLLEKFGARAIETAEDAENARRHGAFLSEVLIRRLGGEWIDIAATDLGYWVMALGMETRVWPFGRVLRYISLGHKERDLVSYFLELQTRLRG